MNLGPGESRVVILNRSAPDPDGSLGRRLFGPDHRYQCRKCGTRFGTLDCPKRCVIGWFPALGRGSISSQYNAIPVPQPCQCIECAPPDAVRR